MKLYQKTTKTDSSIELDLCFTHDQWVLPLGISWFKWKRQMPGHYNAWLTIDIRILCFGLHFTYWKWGR